MIGTASTHHRGACNAVGSAADHDLIDRSEVTVRGLDGEVAF